jgi:hypothetical protein
MAALRARRKLESPQAQEAWLQAKRASAAKYRERCVITDTLDPYLRTMAISGTENNLLRNRGARVALAFARRETFRFEQIFEPEKRIKPWKRR